MTLADLDLPASFVDLTDEPGIIVDLRYATANNFVGRNVYGAYDRLLLHEIAATKLRAAAARLALDHPDRRLLVLDGLRPNRVQRIFWDIVRGTPQQPYVGDPAIGSIHGFGLAVDLTLADAEGRELDMGTAFDDFTPLAEPRREAQFLASGALTRRQVDNRLILRHAMKRCGFNALPIEWWHFDALPPDEVRGRFALVE